MGEVKVEVLPTRARSDFMHEVANTPRGRGVLSCIQCGRCTNSCPVARTTDEHNPRKLVETVILGSRKEVLLGNLPWYCLSCFTCLDRCPQGGDVGEVMFAIRNLAAKEGNIPDGTITQAKNLFETGRVVAPTRMALIKRKRHGLNKDISVDIHEARKILKKTAFVELINKKG